MDLPGGDTNRSIQGDTSTGKQGGQEISLITFDIGQEAAGPEGAAAFPGKDEREVLAPVLVAVFQA